MKIRQSYSPSPLRFTAILLLTTLIGCREETAMPLQTAADGSPATPVTGNDAGPDRAVPPEPIDSPPEQPDVGKDGPNAFDVALDVQPDGISVPDVRSPDDALTCRPGLVPRYWEAGCGLNAPAPVCQTSSQDACARARYCLCDGSVAVGCDLTPTAAWAYEIMRVGPEPGSFPDRCDPAAVLKADAGSDSKPVDAFTDRAPL